MDAPESNEIRPIGNAPNNDDNVGIGGARGGVGLGGICSAEANAEVDGNDDEVEAECVEDEDAVTSKGIGSRFLVDVVVRGNVRV